MEDSPQVQYERRLAAARNLAIELDRQGARLANLRALFFVGALVLLVLPIFGKLPRDAWWGAAAAAVFYVIAAGFHARVVAREERAKLLMQLNLRALGRRGGGWRKHPRRGEQYVDPGDLASGDLDIFGPASLYQLTTEAVTRQGEARLAELFRHGAGSGSAMSELQEAVRDLAPRLDFRQAFSVEAQVAMAAGSDARGLQEWAEGPPVLDSIRWLRWTPFVLPLLTLSLFALGRTGEVHRGAYIPAFLLQLLVVGLSRGPFTRIYSLLSPSERGFARLENAFHKIEGEGFTSPYLTQLTSGLRTKGTSPVSAKLERLGKLFAFVEIRQSGLLHGVLQALFLWDALFFFRLEGWRKHHGPAVGGWLSALADLEALSSLAAYSHAFPERVYPVVSEDGPRFDAKGLGHPLIDAPVLNDVTLAHPGMALVVTGSNMSGKSTLLRAIGVNTVLARCGAPVHATELRMAPLRVLTSMRVKDSLERGVSYFYAEVQRLKAVLDAASEAQGRVLFLLDEILLGTNTRERQIASREVMRLLLGTGAVGAVTTHDLTLTTLEQEPGMKVQNVHFRDELHQDRLHFDYRLRPGVVETTNALRVLRLAGVAIPE